MRPNSIAFRSFTTTILGALLLSGSASAAEVRVMISGGLTAAYKALVPKFERANPSQGAHGPRAVDGHDEQRYPPPLDRGEPADVLIMVGYASRHLDEKREGNC